ncbi:MAG: hypothetical protein ACFWUC_06650 [Oscillospiraceae bacterium]
MKDEIRLLAIAPYESMREMLYKAAAHFDDVHLSVYVGNLDEGVNIVKSCCYNDYDAIIARGGTATLIKSQLSVPVIEIEITAYDILRCLSLFIGSKKKCAVVGYNNIIKNSKLICSILELGIDNFVVENPEDAKKVLAEIADKGYEAILCDAISNNIAWKYGLNSILLTSSIESLSSAIERARMVTANIKKMKCENIFLKDLLNNSMESIIALDKHGTLHYSSLKHDNLAFWNTLRLELENIPARRNHRFVKSLNGNTYNIRFNTLHEYGQEYFVFYIRPYKHSLSYTKWGITLQNNDDAKKIFYNSLFSAVNSSAELKTKYSQYTFEDTPLLILGESSTGKEKLSTWIYLESKSSNSPLIIIDCKLLNEKSIHFLLNSSQSPLSDTGCSVIIKNVENLNDMMFSKLISYIIITKFCSRNRLIINFNTDSTSIQNEIYKKRINDLTHIGCKIITIPPIRSSPDRIETIIKIGIGLFNARNGHSLVAIEPKGMELLKAFNWPGNFHQIERVLNELNSRSSSGFVSTSLVSQVLKEENLKINMLSNRLDKGHVIDLNNKLSDINREIANLVLMDCRGNQTMAAARLGISRTTLWRMLKK